MKRFLKKGMAALLSAVMVVTAAPQLAKEVHAAENQLPTKEQFATVEELKSFNTNDNDGAKNPAKVYFGNNNQQWWIAGSQDGNLTLFATAPVLENQRFNGNSHQYDTQGYDLTWNCDYEDVNPENNEVYVNHYGGSKMRQVILKEVENVLFSAKEREYINATSIYTNDNKNYNWQYKTSDRLYLANMDKSGNNYIYVGKTIRYTYDTGLRIDESYYKNINDFWTRRPGNPGSPRDVSVVSNGKREIRNIYGQYAVVPAFELNLSSAIFASAASAASSDGQLQTSDAFTLRYNSQADIGTATISRSQGSIAVTDVTNENTYLVVQNSDGAWSKKVSSNDLVFASDMDSSLTSFENCKVWLETTSENITYAEEAIQGSGYNVKVNVGEDLTVSGGNTLQTNVSGNITEITINVNDGYYLPDDYISNLQSQLNGLKVTETDNGFTISGTPTSDVNVTLPAVRKEHFVVEGGVKGTDYTYRNGILTFNTNGEYVVKHPGGIKETSDQIVIPKNFEGKLTLDNVTINLNFVPCIDVAGNADLTLMIRGKNQLGVHMGDAAAIQFMNVTDDGRLVIDSEDSKGELKLHGRNGTGIGSPGYSDAYTKNIYINGGIINVSSDNGIGIGSYSGTQSSEITINGGTIEGDKIGSGAPNSTVIVKGGNIKNTFIGETVIDGGFVQGKVSDTKIKNSDGATVYKANIILENSNVKSLKVDGNDYKFPINPGTNNICVYLPVGEHKLTHEDFDGKIYEFTIIIGEGGTVKYVNDWTKELSINGWTYGETANAPSATAKYGDVVYTYSSEENDEYTNEVPENAGTYYVKATVAGSENYTGLESIVSFTIAKADTTLTFEKDNIDKIYDKNAISEPKVSKTGSRNDVVFTWFVANGADWKQLDTAPSDVGTYKVVASVTEDTNYNGTSIEKEFVITKSDSDIQVTLDKSEYTYGDTLTFDINVDLKSDSNLSTRLLQQETVALYLGKQKLSEDVKLKNKKAVVTFDTTTTDQLGELDKDFTFTIKYEGDNNLDVSSKDITVPIHKKSTEITNINDLSKTYDGKVISELTYDINHKESEVQVIYQQFIGDKYEKIEASIVNTGSYRVILTSPATDHYSACEVTKEFEITSADSDITITSEKDTYVYEDQITLDVSVDLAKKLSFFERLFKNDNTVTAYVGDTAISSSVELDKNNHATLTIDTKDEKVRKVLKPSDKALTITVKYNGSENLNNTKNDISVMFHKKDTTVSFKDTAFNLSRVYNGKSVTVDVENDIHKTKNAPKVTLNWNTEDGTALGTAPSQVGKYQLIVSIPEDAYYKGSSVQHDFEISKAELSVEVKVKDKQYDGFNTAEIETAALVGVAEGDKITLINGIPTFDSVEVGENIAIHFTEFMLEAEEDVLNNYTLIQPTGVTASITNTWVPKKDVEYTTSQSNGNGWLKEDFKIHAKEGYLLALGNKADGSRSVNWNKELAGSEEGANSIAFYLKNEQTGAISTRITESYKLDKTKPEVNGLEKDKVYCKEITFTVEETNLDVVKANEKELTPNEKGVYTLTAGNHQITVRDQAGNEAVLAVTVNTEHTPNADDGDCTTTITCAVCGTVVKEAQEHSFTTYTSDSNAGCLTDGTKTAECDHEGCVQTKTVTEKGSALGHDWGEWETVTSPDCENKGSEKRTCKRCSITETKDLDASGHDWEEEFTVDQEATCTEEGSKSIHCKNCDAVKDSTSIPATGHAYGEPEWNWSEDGKIVTVTFICQNDSRHVETKTAEVTSAVKEPATCTQAGITTYTATVSFEENVYTDTKDVADIEALGHDWEEEFTVDKEADCTEEGRKSIHCKNCDETKDNTVIPPTGHKYVHGVCMICEVKDPNYKEHEVIDGSGSSWNKGDENGLSVQKPGEIGKVTDVTLDGKPLIEGTDYEVNNGTVILKPNVLEELKEGNHTLIIYGENGYVETQIKIEPNTTPAPQKPGNPEKPEKPDNKEANQETGSPQTGDSANLVLWIGLLLVSLGSVSITYFYKKKKRN